MEQDWTYIKATGEKFSLTISFGEEAKQKQIIISSKVEGPTGADSTDTLEQKRLDSGKNNIHN